MEDPLLFLEYHRHFTRSLLFVPLGALVASLLLWPLLRNRLSIRRIYLYALLGYAAAGILDVCTSYGAHLLWPFSEERIAWGIISIFDSLFSLMLLVAIVIGVVKHQAFAARVGLLFAVAYLSLGAVQQDRAESLARLQAEQRGHVAERLVVKPTMGNLLLWRSVYEADGEYHVDAVRVGLPGSSRIFAGDRVQVFDLKRDLPQLTEPMTLYGDIERFRFFSDGFLVRHPERPNVLGDVRYAMLPTSAHPLLGIGLNLDAPERHVTFETDRELSDAERKTLFAMLFDSAPLD